MTDYGLDPSAPQPDPTVHLVDRQYVSQFATDSTGIQIYIAGVVGDPDGNAVTVTMKNINEAVVFSESATRQGVGAYTITFTSEQTDTPGYYTLLWDFTISSVAQEIQAYIQIGAGNPAYDALVPEMKAIVESVWVRFSDLFDSPQGGPWLQTMFQTAFSRGRLAQLLSIALGKLNTTAQPYMNYTLDASNEFPYQQWGALLEQALYVETIRHLMRSYVEQAQPVGVTVARNDRRDYMDRWNTVYLMESADLKGQLDHFKIQSMFLSRPRVLVSGGAYGNWGPTRLPGQASARGITRLFGGYF
jgi:hypothetical protein